MNYIKQVNTFYKFLPDNPLSSNAQCLYMYLLNKNNELGWKKEFKIANSIVCGFTNLNISSLQRARNELIQKNYISYKKGISNNAGYYMIIDFEQQSEQQDEQQNEQQDEQQPDNRTNNNPHTLNKQNKTKQNNTSSNDDELKKHFALTWDIYPNKKGRAKAEEYFLQWVKGRKINKNTISLTDKQMYLAVKKYKKECEENQVELQYIKHGDTFFNKAILDYVEVING